MLVGVGVACLEKSCEMGQKIDICRIDQDGISDDDHLTCLNRLLAQSLSPSRLSLLSCGRGGVLVTG